MTRLKEQQTNVVGFAFEEDRLVVDVRPRTRQARCGGCGKKRRTAYDARVRLFRHTDLGETAVYLRYAMRRVDCGRCKRVTTEMVPWAEPGSAFTRDFEDRVGYLMQSTDQTRVAREMRISWVTAGKIAERVVRRLLGGTRLLDGLRRIGIDELSYRKHHKYVTCVVDHDRRRVAWAHEGKSAETVKGFFAELGAEGSGKIELVSIDMSAAYEKAVRDCAPSATIVFDRFHVQKLAQDAVDETRRDLVRELRGTPEARTLKHTRYALQRSVENATEKDGARLADVMFGHKSLFRAWCLKTALVAILGLRSVSTARRRLREWASWASRSRLPSFVRVGRTIRKHLEGILAYIATGLTNARNEGLNGKIRVLTRRAYGFHHVTSLIALIFLTCSGLRLSPRHAPTTT